MSQQKTITLLGALPPTIGGVSIHVERLADTLHANGWQVRVFDLFTAKGVPSTKPYPVVRGRGLGTWMSLLGDVLIRRPKITHVHLSGGQHLPMMAGFLGLIRLTGKLILTIHSGSAKAELGGLTGMRRKLAGLGLRSASRIVCVNEGIAAYLKESLPPLEGKLRHIIPFIAHPKARRDRSRPQGAPALLASGYATPLYEWLTLIEACNQAEGVGRVHLVFYNTYDPEYFPRVEAACARFPDRYVIHKDLTPDAFAELLADIDCFVRPTLTDGDSIAVREALALGIPVIASDSVKRPEGCMLFKTRDAGELRHAIEGAIRAGLPAPQTPIRCAGPQLLALYEEAIAGR